MNSFLNMNNNTILGQNQISNNNWLSTIQSAGSNMNTSTLLIIVAVVLFILVGASYYYFYVIPSTSAQYRANKELIDGKGSGGELSNEAELIFFYADWCPHSKKAKPIWEEIKKTYENKTINGYSIVFTEIDSSTENVQVEKMMDKYNVEGFPTIKLLKDGQIIEYDAKPSKDTLDKFLNSVLN